MRATHGLAALGLVLAVAAVPRDALADDEPRPSRLRPWTGLGEHTLDSFVGWNTLFHVSAVGATYALVETGADDAARDFFHDHPSYGGPGIGGEILGYAAPVLATGILYAIGRASHDEKSLGGAYAVLQASVLTLATVTTLKLFTGRAAPGDTPHVEGNEDAESAFRFGFYRGGIIDGWPSGHTASVTAVATVLATYYRSAAIAIVGGVAVAFTGYSMVSTREGSVHWLSDVVAGFLIAFPIGTTVGRGFRERLDAEESTARSWSIVPMAVRGGAGLSFAVLL